MQTTLDIYLTFPLPAWQEKDFEELHKYCGSVEHIERAFDIEFSCGDGKYLSDFCWEEDEQSLADVQVYDGKVCTNHPPRTQHDGKVLASGKDIRFRAKYDELEDEEVFFLNNKETYRHQVKSW